MFQAIERQNDGTIKLIDQRLLPAEEIWLHCRTLEEVAVAIEDMVVRGAPAIGCTAGFGFVIGVKLAMAECSTWGEYQERFVQTCKRLAATRPTAVNLFYAIEKMEAVAREFDVSTSLQKVFDQFKIAADFMFDDDVRTCIAIGDHGANVAPSGKQGKLRVLTHCNTGSLATAGYGTALGVIRSLFKQGRLEKVYVDETRPYLQGSRLTAFELTQDGIPHEVIADSAAAYLMQQGKIDMAVVGADRIAANGDTANKIGTYSVAVNCHFHGIPFFIAAPLSTIDLDTADGSGIPVEQRTSREISHFREYPITPERSAIHNPAFDVTPSGLIAGIITEKGVATAPYNDRIKALY